MRVGDPGRPLVARQVVEPGRQIEVLAAGERAVRRQELGDVADPATDETRLAHDVEPRDLGVAAGRGQERDQHLDGRRLARAVGTEQSEDLVVDGQVEMVDREDVVEASAQVVGLDGGRRDHGRRSASSRPRRARISSAAARRPSSLAESSARSALSRDRTSRWARPTCSTPVGVRRSWMRRRSSGSLIRSTRSARDEALDEAGCARQAQPDVLGQRREAGARMAADVEQGAAAEGRSARRCPRPASRSGSGERHAG